MENKKDYTPSVYTLKLIEEKYPMAVAFIANKEYQPDGRVSVSLFQRRFRVGYNAAQLLLNKLIENNLVEPFKQWVGTTINGVRTSGNEVTFYRVIQ